MANFRAIYLSVSILCFIFVPSLGKISSLDEFMFINEMYEVIASDTVLFDRIKSSSPVTARKFTEKYNKETKISEISKLKSVITTLMPLIQKIEEWKLYRDGIVSRYDQTVKMETHLDEMEESALIEFAKWSVSHNVQSVRDYVELSHLTLFGPIEKERRTENFFKQLADNFEAHSMDSCFNSSVQQMQSAQQFLYYFYNDIVTMELKSLIIMEFSWMILQVYGVGNFSTEINIVYKEFQQRIKRTFTQFQKVIKQANRIVWRCDPPKHQDKITYDQITELVQGFIVNEVNLSKHKLLKCYDTCGDYKETKRQDCWAQSMCQEQPKCFGTLHDCLYRTRNMQICMTSNFHGPRRYDYIQFDNHRYGPRGLSCEYNKKKQARSWFGGIYMCDYCFCHCYQGEDGDGARYFSLRESLADVRNNKVVTGLRFQKFKNVFHLQIQQGQMLPRAVINSSTIEWQPLRELIVRKAKPAEYHRLSFYKRGIDLSDIESDMKNFVVTGVRLTMRTESYLSLEVKLSKVNFETGKFESSNPLSYWKSDSHCERRVIELQNADVPTRSSKKSIPISRTSDQIHFGPTGNDEDAAQTTIPFIDTQDVFTIPPMPLSGIGIYYKTNPGYGGFIAPRIFTLYMDTLAKIPSIV